MSQQEAQPPAGGQPAGSRQVPLDAAILVAESPGRARVPARFLVLALVAGILAGAASWLVGEVLHVRLQRPLLSTGGIPTPEEARADEQARVGALTLEATLVHGALGAALGLALGLAGGAARGSARAAGLAALLGMIGGGIAGAVATRSLLPFHFRYFNPDQEDLLLSLLIQGGIGAALGAAGGAALGLGIGDRGTAARAILGGLLGAVAGASLYQLLGALAFPLDQTNRPISSAAGTRLFAHLALAICATAGAALTASRAGPESAGD